MSGPVAHSAKGDLGACLAQAARGRSLARELLMEKKTELPYSGAMLDAIALFERLGIRHALAGGLAAMFYGRARFTEDVDFVAVSDHQGVLAAHPDTMREFHFDPNCTYKLYHNSGVEVDIWKDEFADAITGRAVETTLAGRVVRLVEVHDLIAMKLRAGRFQDDYDISEVIKHQQLNRDQIAELVTVEQMRHFVEIEERVRREQERST